MRRHITVLRVANRVADYKETKGIFANEAIFWQGNRIIKISLTNSNGSLAGAGERVNQKASFNLITFLRVALILVALSYFGNGYRLGEILHRDSNVVYNLSFGFVS